MPTSQMHKCYASHSNLTGDGHTLPSQSEGAARFRGETRKQAVFPEVAAECEPNRSEGANMGQDAVPGGRRGSPSSSKGPLNGSTMS